MSSKREEAKAFKRLCEAFPGKVCTLMCQYQTWESRTKYYCTVVGVGCNIYGGKDTSASEAVDDFILAYREF